MYEYITGRVESLTPASAVVEAGGVGYFLNISIQTFSRIGSQTEVKLYTHFVVREDAQILYGFYDRAERDIFRLLIGVRSRGKYGPDDSVILHVGGGVPGGVDRTGRTVEDRKGARVEDRTEDHRRTTGQDRGCGFRCGGVGMAERCG